MLLAIQIVIILFMYTSISSSGISSAFRSLRSNSRACSIRRPFALHVKAPVLNAVYNGDSTDPASYRAIGLGKDKELADVLITDPPYCLLTRRRKGGDLRDPKARQRKLDNDVTVTKFENIREYEVFTQGWMKACIENALSPQANLVIWTNYLGKAPIASAAGRYGFQCVGEYQWCKHSKDLATSPTTLSSGEHLLRVYEVALILTRDPSTVNRWSNNNVNNKINNNNENSSSSAVQSPRDPAAASIPWSVVTGYHPLGSTEAHPHPCHKPFEALEPLLRTWSKPGDLILDPFAGSGAILAATSRIGGRRVLGIEKVKDWANFANQYVRESTIS